MSSVAGLVALPERAAYCASKAAVIGMTRSLAYDLAPHGITVNCICPGSIRTDRAISSTLRAGWTDVDAGLAERAKAIPVGRHGHPEEIAATVATWSRMKQATSSDKRSQSTAEASRRAPSDSAGRICWAGYGACFPA